jgi:hypothetical protein
MEMAEMELLDPPPLPLFNRVMRTASKLAAVLVMGMY